MKRSVIISNKHGVLELPYKLLNDTRKYHENVKSS